MSEKYLFEMLDDIETMISDAKSTRFNPGKVVIEQDFMLTVIEELRKQIPSEIERSHKVMASRDQIISDAQLEAERIMNSATIEAQRLIDDSEIIALAKMRAAEIEKKATEQAKEIMFASTQEADQLRVGALQYTKDLMEDAKGYITTIRKGQEQLFGQLLETLEDDLNSIEGNYHEINQQLEDTINHIEAEETEE